MSPLLLLALACKPPVAPADDQPHTLRVVAFNDWHGALTEVPSAEDPSVALGGLPWLAGAVDALRQDHPDMLLVHAGDAFQGDWAVNASRGMGAVQALDLLGVDVTTVGNHEFDYGGSDTHPLRGALYDSVAASEATWVLANLTEGGAPWAPELGIEPWTLVERGGVKVGITGVLTPDTPSETRAAYVEGLEFSDPAEAVARVLPELEAAGAQVVVVLAHLEGECEPLPPSHGVPGPSCDPQGELGAFLDALPPGVDLVVAGHAHTLIAHRVGDTLVTENRNKGSVLGQVDLVVTREGVDLDASQVLTPWQLAHAPVDPGCTDEPFPQSPLDLGGREISPSADALTLITELEEQAGSLCDRIACTEAPLIRSEEGECPVGDLVAESMLAAFAEADLAVANTGGLRADLPGGELRKEHAQAVVPFDNYLLLVEMTGAQVELLLRIGSSDGGPIQVAGASYVFDPTLSEGEDLDGDGTVSDWEHDRLCSVTVGSEPLDPEGTYKVVVTDFLQGGGDHLGPAFEGAPVLSTAGLARDALVDWLAAREGCLGAVVDPESPRVQVGSCP